MRPNFVFILADDLGYADLACYGGRVKCSPNLDRMAAEGRLFTNAYANSAVCSPSRFAIATGRWQYRFRGGADEPIRLGKGSKRIGLPPEHPTMASALRDAGYATALFGKWHMGDLPEFGPLKSGYDEFFGHMGGAVDYFRHEANGIHDLYEGEQEVEREGYLTDLLSERAVAFVRKHGGSKPFLVSLHYNAPHWPWETRDDEAEAQRIESIFHLDGGSVETYLTMIRQMDEGIGGVLAALDDTGVTRDTVVVFTSDNGGERFSDTYPLMGKKMDLLEGGIRVPAIARWPSRLPAGETDARLAIGMDWTPTFLATAGVSPDPAYPLDGVDLFGDEVERSLYWRMKFRSQKAVRSGVWKYLSIDGNEFLYDLSRDARERANMKHREPAKFEALRNEYSEWDQSMPPIPEDATFDVVYTEATMAKSAG